MKRAFLFIIFFVIGYFVACFICTRVSNDSNTNTKDKDTVTVNDSVTYTDNDIQDWILIQSTLLNNK